MRLIFKIFVIMLLSVLLISNSYALFGGDSSPHYNITVVDTETNNSVYWIFNGISTEAYENSYDYTLIRQDDEDYYYLDSMDATSMWSKEPSMYLIDKAILDAQDEATSTSYILTNKEYGFVKTKNKVQYPSELKRPIPFDNHNNMTIEYKQGKKISTNENSKEIVHIWIGGEKVF